MNPILSFLFSQDFLLVLVVLILFVYVTEPRKMWAKYMRKTKQENFGSSDPFYYVRMTFYVLVVLLIMLFGARYQNIIFTFFSYIPFFNRFVVEDVSQSSQEEYQYDDSDDVEEMGYDDNASVMSDE